MFSQIERKPALWAGVVDNIIILLSRLVYFYLPSSSQVLFRWCSFRRNTNFDAGLSSSFLPHATLVDLEKSTFKITLNHAKSSIPDVMRLNLHSCVSLNFSIHIRLYLKNRIWLLLRIILIKAGGVDCDCIVVALSHHQSRCFSVRLLLRGRCLRMQSLA